MIIYHVKKSGNLFNDRTITKTNIRKALDKTALWAENRLRSISPIATGELRRGWYVRSNKASLRIDNPVSYTKYVDKRINMIGKTVPQVQRELKKNIELMMK